MLSGWRAAGAFIAVTTAVHALLPEINGTIGPAIAD
jgi:hypothetical protein